MAGRIAGITIDIGGDTTKLQSALKGVDSKLRNMQFGLRDVNRLMKFDPTSTTLITQKQQLLKESINKTRERLQTLKEAQKQMDDNKVDKNSDQYQRLQREIMATEGRLKNLEKQYSQVASVAGTKLQAMGDKMKDLGGKISEAGQAVTQKLTVPIAALGGIAIKSFADVDKGMDAIVKKTGATGDALERMKDSAKTLATEIPTDFETAGSAIGEVNTRFDISGSKLEDLSGLFIKFAKLNNVDVSQAVDKTQKALAAYGKGADDAGSYLDRLNKVGQDTGVSVEKLQDGIVQNATAFKEMGLSLDSATVLMGSLEKSGVNSETVLNGMRKALKNAAKEGKPLNQALEEMQDAIENGTGSVDGLTAAYDLFGKSGDQIYGAVKDGMINFRDLAITVDDASGSIEQTFENTLDPIDKFKMAINQAKLAGADLGGAILTTLTPMIERLQTTLKNLGEKFQSLTPKQKDMIVKIGLIAAAIGPALVVIGKLSAGLGAVTSVVGKAMNGISALIAGTAGIAAPVIAAVAAIGGLVAAGYAIKKSSDKAIESQHEFTEEQRKSIDAINDLTEAYNQADEAAKEKNETISAEFGHVRDLKEEYNGLVDSNGKIAESDKARAEVILGELAQALGMEKSQIQELIDKNGKLAGSIDEVIVKKEAQAYLDANYDSYVEAIQLQTTNTDKLGDALQAVTDKENEAAAAKQRLVDAQNQLSNAQEWGARNTGSLQTQVDNAQRSYDAAKAKLDEAKSAVKEYSDASADASQKIANYQQLQEAAQTGAIDKINDAMSVYQNNLKTATTATKEELDQQAADAKKKYSAIKDAFEKGDVTKATVDAAKKRADAAAQEASKVSASARSESNAVTSNASSAASNATKSASTANTNVTSYYRNMSNSVAGMFPRNLGQLFKGTLVKITTTIKEKAHGTADISQGIKRTQFARGYTNPLLFTSPTFLGNGLFGDRGNAYGGELIYGRQSLMRDIREAVGQNGNTINITVNGSESPEDFANRFVREYNLLARTV